MLKKFVTGFVTGSLLLGSAMPMFADVTVDVSGNGENSSNTVYVKNKCKTEVTQSNVTAATINLDVKGNSGENKANGNTDGNVTIDTGNVTNDVTVDVTGGDNTAVVPACCCDESGNTLTDVVVSGNGKDSTTDVTVRNKKKLKTSQSGTTAATVTGKVKGKSGKNKAKNNTGGTVDVLTGNVDNTVGVTVTGGSNTLN